MNSSKKKMLTNVSIALLLSVSFLYFGMDYFVKEIAVSSEKIIEDKQNIYLLNVKNSRLDDSRKRYKEIKNEMDEASKVIIDKNDTVSFIKEVEKTAADDKVKQKINTASAPTDKVSSKKSSISSTYFNITVGGSFENVMHFLGHMENFKYYTDIENVKMSFGEFDQYNKDVILLTFNIKLYQKDS